MSEPNDRAIEENSSIFKTPGETAAELALIEAVAAGLKGLGLHGHVAHARGYWKLVKAGKAPPKLDAWNHTLVVHWAAILKIPPYEDRYPVRRRGPGPKCTCAAPRSFTSGTFPGGWTSTCSNCNLTWMTYEDDAGPRAIR